MESNNKALLTQIIKRHTEAFLLDAAEFFPFGAYINKNNELVPCSAYVESEDDRPESITLINILETHFDKELKNGDIIAAAIGIDVIIRKNGQAFDALEIRFFASNKTDMERFKYAIQSDHVDFGG